jgi:serine protease
LQIVGGSAIFNNLNSVGMRSIYPIFILLANFSFVCARNTFTSLPPTRAEFTKGIGTDDYVPGRVFLKVFPENRALCAPTGILHHRMDAAIQSLHATRLRRAFPQAQPPTERCNAIGQPMVDLSLTYELFFDPSLDVFEAANLLMRTGLFEYVEPHYVQQPLYTPNDPFVPSQYHLALIQAFAAWDISKGDTSVVIGIVDTGTSFAHPELQGKHAYNWADTIDGLDNDADGYIDNFQGWDMSGNDWFSLGDNDPSFCCNAVATDHGVIVGGPVAAATDNNNMGASVGFNCRELPIKVSIDESPTIYNGYQGIVYGADHGAHILNLSWGGISRTKFGEDAINYALVNRGVMIVASAGNTVGFLDFYPASFDGVISCGGTQANDAFWNTTASFGTSYHYLVDVCAPSRDIPTNSFVNTYGNFTGTSLGAPIVCAIGGLVKAQYPNLSMAQVAQRVRVTCDQGIYGINPTTYTERMGRGRVNAYRALIDATPSVRIAAIAFDDGADGLIQPGDTVSVRVRFVNYLSPVTNLDIQLSTPDWGQFEVLHTDVHAGDLGTMDTASTWLAPFKIVVRSSAPAGFEGHLKFNFTGTNYSDWEYYQLRVQPSYVNIDLNRIETSMTGTGRWGYQNFPGLSIGKGLVLDGVAGMMEDAGFMIGTDATHVSNNFENASGNAADNHFVNMSPIKREMPGNISPLQARTVYSDAGAGANALGVVVDQRTYQWNEAPHDNYYIQEYRIANTTASPLNGVYAGMYMNLDMFWSSNNVSRYDTIARAIYSFREEWVTLWEIGAALLTPDSLHGFASIENSFAYSPAAKWAALSSPPQAAGLANQSLVQFISAGPFNIAPGDTHIVAFAVVLGDSISHLRDVVAEANERYWCLVRGGMTQHPTLGNDIQDCSGGPAPILDAGAGFTAYSWNALAANANTQTVTATQNGEYWVRVTDANGCTDEDYIRVTRTASLDGGFTCFPTQFNNGDTVIFADTTANGVEWGWDFGDGSTLCPITPTVSHQYSQPGTYLVTMYVGNGVCVDTVTKTLVVDTLVGIVPGIANLHLKVYPNPATASVKVSLSQAPIGQADLSMTDIHGRLVMKATPNWDNGAVELDLSGFAKGMYFLSVATDKGIETAKLMVE